MAVKVGHVDDVAASEQSRDDAGYSPATRHGGKCRQGYFLPVCFGIEQRRPKERKAGGDLTTCHEPDLHQAAQKERASPSTLSLSLKRRPKKTKKKKKDSGHQPWNGKGTDPKNLASWKKNEVRQSLTRCPDQQKRQLAACGRCSRAVNVCSFFLFFLFSVVSAAAVLIYLFVCLLLSWGILLLSFLLHFFTKKKKRAYF